MKCFTPACANFPAMHQAWLQDGYGGFSVRLPEWFRWLPMLLLLLVQPAFAEQVIGEVIRSQNMADYPVGKKLMENSEIRTRKNQKLALRTRQGDVLIANQNTRIKLVKPGFFSQLFGRIYYLISPRRDHQVRVDTATATIGIRGTKFIVDSAQNHNLAAQVMLEQGELQLDAKDNGEFALYQQRALSEFEQYKRQVLGEFKAYKQQMMEQFVAYKTSIRLQSGFALAFDGNKVVRKPMDAQQSGEFAEFEQFIADHPRAAGE